MQLFKTALILIVFAILASASSIIVAKSGGDYSTIQAGLNAANGSDTVFVKAGTYVEKITFDKSGNSATSRIVLRNFGTDTVIVDGAGLNQAAIITIENKSHLSIIGLEVCNNTATSCPIGISIEGFGANITVKNCIVHGIKKPNDNAHGIAVYGSNGTTPVSSLVLDGNTIYGCKLGQSESMVLNGNVDGFEVTNNVIYDNDNIGIDFIGFEGTAPQNDQARNGICAGNRVYDISSGDNPTYNGERSADGIYVDGGRDIVIERNIVDSCDIGIEVASEHNGKTTSNITVRNNFVSRSFQGNIMTGGYAANKGNAENIILVNNTLFGGNDGEIVLQFNNKGICIKNNICYAKSGTAYLNNAGSNNTTVIVDNNLYYGASISSPGDWSDAHAKFINPELVGPPSNMHLLSTSGAIHAGASLSADTIGQKDIDGQDRIQNTAVDIGADEYAGTNPIIHFQHSADTYQHTPLQSLVRQAEKVSVYAVSGRCVLRSDTPTMQSINGFLNAQTAANGAFIFIITVKGETVERKWIAGR